MKSWKKLLSLTAACALSVSLLAGCGGTTTPSDSPGSGGEAAGGDRFHIALTAPFTGFDPLRTNDSASTYVNAQIYETLYRINPETDEYDPLLAAEMPEYSEDGLSVTVKLREGVTFHDGTPFNSEAVKYTFELIKDPEFGSARASIANSIASMECPDDYTIVFHLLYEDGVFTAKLAHTNSAIVSPTAQQNQDLMVEPCGTGPYKFVSSVSGSNVVLTRNDEYWGGAPAIKDVTMTIISDESTAVSRMETGEADFMPKDGEQLRIMLANLETQENALMQLFSGITERDTMEAVVKFVPVKEVDRQLLFRFSKWMGITDADDLGGNPYYISVEDKHVTPSIHDELLSRKKAKDNGGLYVNLPGKIQVTLYKGNEQWAAYELYAAQFGTVAALDEDLFGKKLFTSVVLNPVTGNLESIEIDSARK